MKKLLAICLTFIMVISVLAVPAFAATVEVPAKTLVGQSFAGLAEAPEGWDVTSSNGTVSYEPNCFQYAPDRVDSVKYAKLAYGSAFNTMGKEYTYSFKLSHYDGNCYIHFGADSAANAIVDSTDADGFTLYTGIGRNSDWNKGFYDLYLDGTLLGSIIDPGSNVAYRSLREFKFVVNEDGVTATIGGAGETHFDIPEGAASDFEGYVGFHLANNSGYLYNYVTKLSDVKLATAAYSYDINASQKITGAYAVVGREFTESHTGTMYINNTEEYKFGGNNAASKVLGTITDGADNMTIEANYTPYPGFNEVQLSFMGYTLYSGHGMTASGNWVLKQGTAELGKAPMGVLQGNTTYHTVKIEFVDGQIKLYADDSLKFTVNDPTPSRSGEVKLKNNYSLSEGAKYVKVYSADYADTSSYVDITKTDFILDKTFTANDTVESLNADGFTRINGVIGENGITVTTNAQAGFEYTAASFGGDFTFETKAYGTYNNPETITFTTAAGDYYKLATTKSDVKITKKVGSAAEETLDTIDTATYYIPTRAHKVTFAYNEGKLTITAYVNNTKTIEVVDESPITDAFKLSVKTGYNTNSTVYNVKVYPTSAADELGYVGNFDINGNAVTDVVKGNTYFTFPVTMLGQSPDFIAALYEDGKMTDIKFFDVAAANSGLVQLFDTTASTANKVEIKVFVWDTLEGMIPVLAPFTLD